MGEGEGAEFLESRSSKWEQALDEETRSLLEPFAEEPGQRSKAEESIEEEEMLPMTDIQLKNFKKVLKKHGSIFWGKGVPPNAPNVVHQIEIKEGCSVDHLKQQPMRRFPLEDEKEIAEKIDELHRGGQIEQCLDAKHACHVVWVRTPGKKSRLCIDFKPINAITKPDPWPMARMDDILIAMSGMKVFSCLDAARGYWQVPLHPDSKRLTAFRFQGQVWQWTVMPMGLVNAPATFNRWMAEVFRGLKFIHCYVDDFTVASRTVDEHIKHLDAMLHRCSMHGVRLRKDKSQFMREQINLLGHVVGVNGIRPQTAKVEAISKMQSPKTKKQLRSFLGMIQFYRAFVPGLAEICAPLYALTKKGVWKKDAWNDQCNDAFEHAKRMLSKAPTLAWPDFTRRFYVRTDASQYGLGATLMQFSEQDEPRVIEFWSRALSAAERNYQATKREALAITEAVLKWRYYLQSQPFEVITDHKPLLAMKESTQSYLQRWRLRLAPYSFKIRWQPGENMGTEDALSRDSRHEAVPMCSLVTFEALVQEADGSSGLQVVQGEQINTKVAEEPAERQRLAELEAAFRPRDKQAWDAKVKALRSRCTKQKGTLQQQKNLQHVATNFVLHPMQWTWDHTKTGWSAYPVKEPGDGARVPVHQLVDGQEASSSSGEADTDAEAIMGMLNPTHDTFKDMQEADEEIAAVKKWLVGETSAMSEGEKAQARRGAVGCKLLHDVVVKQRPSTGAWVPWVPAVHRPTVLYLCHDHALGAHVGRNRLEERIRERFFWPTLQKDVQEWCKRCSCARSKLTRQPRRGLTQTWSHYGPLECVQMDLVGPFPRSRSGNRYWLTLIDRFSRDVELVPIPDASAETTAKALFRSWVCRRGTPKFLMSDNGANFTSDVIKELCASLGIKQMFSAPYHPQANGLCERAHRFALAALQQAVAGQLTTWDERLDAIRFGMITSKIAGHRVTPFQLLHGFAARLPAESLVATDLKAPQTVGEFFNFMTAQWQEVRAIFQQEMVVSAAKMRLKRDERMRRFVSKLKVGASVYWTRPHFNQKEGEVGRRKLLGKWSKEPARILEKRGNAYLLQEKDGNTVRVAAIDLALDPNEGNPMRESAPQLTTLLEIEEQEVQEEEKQEEPEEGTMGIEEAQIESEIEELQQPEAESIGRKEARSENGVEALEQSSATDIEEEKEGGDVEFTVSLPTLRTDREHRFAILAGPDGDQRGAQQVAQGRWQFLYRGLPLYWHPSTGRHGFKQVTQASLKKGKKIPAHWKPWLVESVGTKADDWRLTSRHKSIADLQCRLAPEDEVALEV